VHARVDQLRLGAAGLHVSRVSTWVVELAHPRWNASAQTLKFSVEVPPCAAVPALWQYADMRPKQAPACHARHR